MPTPTYTLIQEQVLGSAAASVTFSSIPGTYKDLVLEWIGSASVSDNAYIRFNGDTTTNYSTTQMSGNGTAATSGRRSNFSAILIGDGGPTTTISTGIVHIQSYTSTNVNKTTICRMSDTASYVQETVGLWRKTPEAITSMVCGLYSGASWTVGSTFRLWGVAG